MRRKLPAASTVGELNLVPYMDVVVNLILFLMLTSSGFTSFGLLDASAPAVATDSSREPALNLTVTISQRGFSVLTDDAAVPIPKQRDTYDYAGLTAAVAEIKRAHRNETRLIVTAEAGITYDVLVAVMDATRHDANGALFPDVVIRPR